MKIAELKVKNEKNELCNIMTKYGSDKGNGHTYTRYYYEMFKDKRNELLNIFEVGLGTNNIDVPSNMGRHGKPGASLKGWKEFFPNAQIFGGDVDSRILFEESRIKTYFCDQLKSETLVEMWNKIPETFDIIVDDGLHSPQANLNFFENSYHKLKETGIYIIEDIFECNLQQYIDYMTEHKYPYHIFLLDKHTDNNFVVIWK